MDRKIVVKICGMKESTNIASLLQLPVDYIGLIFYEKSLRFAGNVDPQIFAQHTIRKVGVFVNQPIEDVLERQLDFQLDVIQLHGQEPPSYCAALKDKGFTVWKAFGVNTEFDFTKLDEYGDVVDCFLFDTQTPAHGGSGNTFDWGLLNHYTGQLPYLLSGGIGLHNLEAALEQKDTRLIGLDLNSKLEIAPGIKDIDLVHKALKIIHHEQISSR
ncbi:phosphoribosylanthranilate isomerase [Sphingobacterium sp. lm-10]|uniref:phosphoribosylanthranilate isomerase n=1 Tax=Sphingobacterium sp. lm-10 TaxID=2944904 RepID=UPI0020205DC9|nr:phosphoribosylanthranilate isomerase [Sphingobacterium sp. lm-10]MCL7988905.1 phosphoribosylanthranilate isomerase [Sphingobacterium sp. lm-10]